MGLRSARDKTGVHMSTELSPLGKLALEAAFQGVEVVVEARKRGFDVHTKSSHRDLVTDVDTAAERAVTSYIRERRPTDPIIAEESGEHEGSGAVRWVIDPIDGTANFVHNRPDFAVAVSAEIAGKPSIGAIVKPATGEWIACDERGGILMHEGTPRVSTAQTLNESLISLSVSINEKRRPLTLSTLARLLPEVQDFRRTGSTSCDLYAVATGSLDAYIGIGSNPWDIAPGWAVVEAAGGECLRFPVAGGQEAFVLGTPAVTGRIASIVTEHAMTFAASRGMTGPGQRVAASSGRSAGAPQLPPTRPRGDLGPGR